MLAARPPDPTVVSRALSALVFSRNSPLPSARALPRASPPLLRPFSSTRASMGSSQRLRVASRADLSASGSKKAYKFGGEGDDAPQVLLSNVAGKIYGTSAKCTHYGAPLENGVLTAEGRVVCPWHGACFKVQTGDIEDAPGLDSLVSVKVELEGDDIYVTADPEQLKGKPGVAPSCGSSVKDSGKGLVIVGGGAGAINLIESARKAGYSAPITLLTNEEHAPIDRTKLSKGLITDAGAVTWRSPAHLKNVLRVDLRTGAEVASIDAEAQKVHTSKGEAVEYETLVLATGGTPRWLPVPGAKQGQLGNVFVVRGLAHTQALLAALGDGADKDVVVVGSSFIGCEAAIALMGQKKARSVAVVGMEAQPFERVLGAKVGEGLRKAAEKNQGIKFYMQAGVESLQNADGKSDGGDVKKVVIKDENGKQVTLNADVVVLGVGVAPATEYLKQSKGFQLQKDGSIEVDQNLRVKGAPGSADIYAVGDIATAPTRDGKSTIRIEHWNVASNQGRAVGELLAKGGSGGGSAFDKVPIFWSALGSQLRYVSDGNGGQFDDVYLQGDPSELKFAAFYAKGDTVTAVATMGRDPLVMQCSELLRIGKMPSLKEIKDGKDPLQIALAA